MINQWKSLTQDNKVNLIIPILIGVLAVVGYFGKGWFESPTKAKTTTSATVTQTTSGDSSPTVSSTKGDVIININGSGSGKQP